MSSLVLIIDDDEAIREMVQVMLEDASYKVIVAQDGVEALQKLEATRPDLIVTDLVMPSMNGYTFLNLLRQKQLSPIPIIVFTASTTSIQEVEQIEVAGYTYLAKPFEMDELLTKINQLLTNSQIQPVTNGNRISYNKETFCLALRKIHGKP